MWQIIGWVFWAILVFFAVSFAYGCRTYAKLGHGFQWATAIQTFFCWLIAILFLVFGWNKLHILWVAPIAFFSAQFLVLGVPILTPIVLFATKMFLAIILLGVRKPDFPGSYSNSEIKKRALNIEDSLYSDDTRKITTNKAETEKIKKQPYICKKCGKEMWSLVEVAEVWDEIYCKNCRP
jgi:DNA-directed RNA polymerase subunit RPC12/RpoP